MVDINELIRVRPEPGTHIPEPIQGEPTGLEAQEIVDKLTVQFEHTPMVKLRLELCAVHLHNEIAYRLNTRLPDKMVVGYAVEGSRLNLFLFTTPDGEGLLRGMGFPDVFVMSRFVMGLMQEHTTNSDRYGLV